MIEGPLRYAGWGVRRRWRDNRAAYVSVGTMALLAFATVGFAQVSDAQLSGMVVGNGGQNQLASASGIMFGLGMAVSVLQTQILVARLLRGRRSEFVLLSSIGVSTRTVLAVTVAEHAVHLFVGSIMGAVSGLILAGLWVVQVGAVGTSWYGFGMAIVASLVLPLIALLPITMILVPAYTRERGAA